ncbi:unnamed protein product, partial [Ilex paraguariensis]
MSNSVSIESNPVPYNLLLRQFYANGVCIETTVIEEKLNEGNILEAEFALRDGLSLNFENTSVSLHLLPTIEEKSEQKS